MKLNEEQEKSLQEYPPIPSCNECGQELTKCYCGRCDQYYNSGHSLDCSRMSRSASWSDNHIDCGRY